MLPVVAQGIDAYHRVTEFGHFTGDITVQVAPAAIAGEEQGHSVGGLPGRDFYYRYFQGIPGLAFQCLHQLAFEHLR
ncbi:hypothetical protein D3C76_236060 [compost metagenome]